MADSKSKKAGFRAKMKEAVAREVREPRILLYDLETSLQTVAVFQLGGNDWIQQHPTGASHYLCGMAVVGRR
jgi:hypothetical protein